MLGHVAAHLGIDALRRPPQRQLAQRDEVALAEKLIDRAGGLLGDLHFPVPQPL
jgi:hypothetical protein